MTSPVVGARRRRQAVVASGKAYPPSDRQREGPDGYKLSRSDDAGDVGREEVSVANETFRRRAAAAAKPDHLPNAAELLVPKSAKIDVTPTESLGVASKNAKIGTE